MDASYLFAKNFANTKYEDLSSEVVEATKKEILDLLGVALGGANQPGATHVCELMKEWGGKEESSIIGSKQKVPAPNAAQANATMAHALDFDDVHEAAVMHPGIASIPVVLAVGEAQGNLSGKEFITSTALGVDMMCRLALATTPGKSPIELGWHLTSLFGFMGSAAVAARVMHLDEEKIVDAIGIGYHQCAGNGLKDSVPDLPLREALRRRCWQRRALRERRILSKASGVSINSTWMGITARKFLRQNWESGSRVLTL
jgi:2-methylcitrate dehydratase PrpD